MECWIPVISTFICMCPVCSAEKWLPRCRLSCHVCRLQPNSLRVVRVDKDSDTQLRIASSWHFAPPATHRYPPGAKVGATHVTHGQRCIMHSG
jgi:hypothetical protein